MILRWKDNLTDHFTPQEYMIGNKSNATCYLDRDSMEHAQMLEEFRVWLDRPIIVTSWYRTPEYNKEVGGIASSNHLKGCATDWHTDITITDQKFIKYAKKWKAICKAHKVNGEAGLYKWGMHVGSHCTVKGFVNWDSRSGKQKTNAFKI